MKHNTIQTPTTHPLEDIFGISSGTTLVEHKEFIPAEVVNVVQYDEKDKEIEGKLEEIYTIAMGQVELMGDEVEKVEGKFKARIGEVTANMLTVALNAVKQKADLKIHKDKTIAGPKTVNNNLNVTADRNELLKMFLSTK